MPTSEQSDAASMSSMSSCKLSVNSEEVEVGKKRHRTWTDDEGDSAEEGNNDVDDQEIDDESAVPATEVGGVKEVEKRSGKNAKKLRDAYKDGTLVIDVNGASYREYKRKIKAIDKHAIFGTEYQQLFRPVCSKCQSPAPYKEPYDSTRFRKHHTTECSGKPRKSKKVKTGPNIFLAMFPGFSSKKSASPNPTASSPAPARMVPCPGITANDETRIPQYLARCPSGGGGGRAVFKIAMEKFKRMFSELKGVHREEVLLKQEHEWKWRNNHNQQRVFSVTCDKEVTSPAIGKRPQPCTPCSRVLRSKPFRNALRKKTPEPQKAKHTNYRFRPEVLAHLFAKYTGLENIFVAVSHLHHFSSINILI